MTNKDIKELGLPNYEEIQRAFMETDHYNHCHRSGIEWQDGAEWMRSIAIDAIKKKEKEMIDKACEVFARFLQIINQKLDNKHVGVRFEEVGCMRDFRKAMEE